MINKIKIKLQNKDTKTLVSNFSYLTIIEISNYILPFITIPYIVRTIGVEKYGAIMFAYSVMIFFNVITSFGFKLLATKYISINRDDVKKVSKYFWSVILTQMMLLMFSFSVLLILLFNIERFHNEMSVLLYSFGMVLGNVIFPVWFFQGMEKMKYISIFTVVSRLIYTILIFTLVASIENYELIPLINSLSLIAIGLFSLYFIHAKFEVEFVLVSINDMIKLLKEGWHLFLSTLSNNLYTATNTVLLGFLTNYSVVGVFSIASTISGAITKIIKIYSRVTFPYIAKFDKDKELQILKARLLLRVYSVILFTTGLMTFLSADFLITLLFGANHEESILVLQILSITIMIEPLGGFFTPYLVIKNQTKTVAKITFQTMLMNFVVVVPLIYIFQAKGMAIAKVIVEGFQVLLNIKYNKELILPKGNTKK